MAALLLFTKTVGSMALLGQVARADEVSLIQDVKTKMAVNRPTQHTATTLLERASSMLKNGATDDVTIFVNAIADEIVSTVMPKINNESAADQGLINANFAEFANLVGRLAEDNVAVRQKGEQEALQSKNHKVCRDTESIKCGLKRTCDMGLFQLWSKWYNAEEALSNQHATFSGNFCGAEDDGQAIFRTQTSDTNSKFRVQASIDMGLYIEKEGNVRDANKIYNDEVVDCQKQYTDLDTQGAQCNELQLSVESHSCAYAVDIRDTLSEFHNSWNNALKTYNNQVTAVKQLQVDRILEHSTLETVKCLLEQVRSRAGQPCDEKTGEFDQELATCHDVQQNTGHLDLTYPDVPAVPQECETRDDVGSATGPVCLPVLQPMPCDDRWNTEEVSTWPPFPEGSFTSTNPSCNSAQACVRCPHLD